MSAVLHEGAQHGWRVEILTAIHINGTESNGGSELGVEIEDRLCRLLFGPILAKSDGMSDEGRVGVMQKGENGIVTIGAILDAISTNGIGREHGGMLKGTKNVVLPIEEVSRLVTGNVSAKYETLTIAVTGRQQLVGDDVNATGIAVSREKFIPGPEAMMRDVSTVWNVLLEFLCVIKIRKYRTIANDDLFTSNVGLMKEVARVRTSCGRNEGNQVLNGDNDVGILVIVVALFDI